MLRLQLLRCTHRTISASVRSCTVYSAAKPMAVAGDAVRIVVGYRFDTATLARQMVGQNVRLETLQTSVLTSDSVQVEVDPQAQLNNGDVQVRLTDMLDQQDCQIHFDYHTYFTHLPSSSHLGATVLATEQMQSTQTFLQNNMSIIPDNSLCIAYRQSGGKGRGGNVWESPPGCLMFSVYKKGSKIDIRIKWPNDIYSKGMKLGGVLCHSTYRQQEFHVVIGVGLNLDNSRPTTCINDLIKQRQSQLGMSDHSDPITREELLACVLTQLEAMTGTLAGHGFGPLQEDYLQAWLHTNQQVTLIEDGSQEISLTVVGLTKYGYLRAVSNGEEYALHPDGNSLDFFKGLIRHKLE